MPDFSSSNSAQTQFVALLREMFQIQDLDLDFGIYRVLNQEKKLIRNFLDERLAPITRDALGAADNTVRAAKQQQLDDAIAQRRSEGDSDEDIEGSSAIKRMRAELEALGNSDALETEVYNGLTEFFGRYYDKGDFLSRPRYKKDVYALPYNGEEVKLHWANRDQYYIKSAQVLEAFDWNLNGQKVRFQIREAGTAENTTKEDRSFILALDKDENDEKDIGTPVVTEENGVLTVWFDFKKTSGGPRDLNVDAEKRLRESIAAADITVAAASAPPVIPVAAASAPPVMKDGGTEAAATDTGTAATASVEAKKESLRKILAPFSADKSHFLHRLNSWTARKDFDFFVHKDLRTFLKRELDFFLKNEVVRLDDLFADQAATWEKTTLAKARAMHELGGKIIEFLASLETLQKRLWEKQKWITQSSAIVPLRLIPDAMRETVLNNAAQIAEWKTLYGVDSARNSTVLVAWSEPPSADWIEQNGDIAVDTKHFDEAFARRLWSALSREYSLDDLWNGVLWNADNFAALNLMQARFAESVKCIYIDPPYNTGGDGFLYKDAYQHSSWLSMMQDRLELARELMSDTAAIFVSCDDQEQARNRLLCDSIFDSQNLLAQVIWDLGSGTAAGHFTRAHEYVLAYARQKSSFPNFKYHGDEDLITERALKRISAANPASEITFPSGMHYEGTNATFEGKFGSSEVVEVIGEKMEFKDGKLVSPVTLRAGWGMRNQIISWLSGEETYDTKAQKVTRFYFDAGGRLQYEKERGVINPPSVMRGIASTRKGQQVLMNLMGEGFFSFPKPIEVISYLCNLATSPKENDIILDYFAGSGTTGHAVINLNRADGENGRRKYLLVEQGKYFDSVLVPRLKKAAFADKWRDGKPSEYSQRGGVAQTLLCYRLESYEDALEHLASVVEESGQLQIEAPDDDFTVRYALAMRTGDGELPLSDELFQTPFAMQMKVGGNDVKESQTVTPDAIATFNWLLGLRVQKMWFKSFGGTEAAATPQLAAVCGLLPDNRAAVIVWRHLKGETYEAADEALRDFWQTDEILQSWRATHAPAVVYVNGDSTLGALKGAGEAWEIAALEAEFRRLMFASAPQAPE